MKLKEEAHQIMENIMNMGVNRSKIYIQLAGRMKIPLYKAHFAYMSDERDVRRAILHLKAIRYEYGVKLGRYHVPKYPKKVKKKVDYKKTLDPEDLRKALAQRKPLTIWQKVRNLLNRLGQN